MHLFRHGTDKCYHIFSHSEIVYVGSGSDCTVQVTGRHVEKHHCRLLKLPPHGTLAVANFETNLTYVNNVLLDEDGALCELPLDGLLSLGVPPDIARLAPHKYVLLKLLRPDAACPDGPSDKCFQEQDQQVSAAILCDLPTGQPDSSASVANRMADGSVTDSDIVQRLAIASTRQTFQVAKEPINGPAITETDKRSAELVSTVDDPSSDNDGEGSGGEGSGSSSNDSESSSDDDDSSDGDGSASGDDVEMSQDNLNKGVSQNNNSDCHMGEFQDNNSRGEREEHSQRTDAALSCHITNSELPKVEDGDLFFEASSSTPALRPSDVPCAVSSYTASMPKPNLANASPFTQPDTKFSVKAAYFNDENIPPFPHNNGFPKSSIKQMRTENSSSDHSSQRYTSNAAVSSSMNRSTSILRILQVLTAPTAPDISVSVARKSRKPSVYPSSCSSLRAQKESADCRHLLDAAAEVRVSRTNTSSFLAQSSTSFTDNVVEDSCSSIQRKPLPDSRISDQLGHRSQKTSYSSNRNKVQSSSFGLPDILWPSSFVHSESVHVKCEPLTAHQTAPSLPLFTNTDYPTSVISSRNVQQSLTASAIINQLSIVNPAVSASKALVGPTATSDTTVSASKALVGSIATTDTTHFPPKLLIAPTATTDTNVSASKALVASTVATDTNVSASKALVASTATTDATVSNSWHYATTTRIKTEHIECDEIDSNVLNEQSSSLESDFHHKIEIVEDSCHSPSLLAAENVALHSMKVEPKSDFLCHPTDLNLIETKEESLYENFQFEDCTNSSFEPFVKEEGYINLSLRSIVKGGGCINPSVRPIVKGEGCIKPSLEPLVKGGGRTSPSVKPIVQEEPRSNQCSFALGPARHVPVNVESIYEELSQSDDALPDLALEDQRVSGRRSPTARNYGLHQRELQVHFPCAVLSAASQNTPNGDVKTEEGSISNASGTWRTLGLTLPPSGGSGSVGLVHQNLAFKIRDCSVKLRKLPSQSLPIRKQGNHKTVTDLACRDINDPCQLSVDNQSELKSETRESGSATLLTFDDQERDTNDVIVLETSFAIGDDVVLYDSGGDFETLIGGIHLQRTGDPSSSSQCQGQKLLVKALDDHDSAVSISDRLPESCKGQFSQPQQSKNAFIMEQIKKFFREKVAVEHSIDETMTPSPANKNQGQTNKKSKCTPSTNISSTRQRSVDADAAECGPMVLHDPLLEKSDMAGCATSFPSSVVSEVRTADRGGKAPRVVSPTCSNSYKQKFKWSAGSETLHTIEPNPVSVQPQSYNDFSLNIPNVLTESARIREESGNERLNFCPENILNEPRKAKCNGGRDESVSSRGLRPLQGEKCHEKTELTVSQMMHWNFKIPKKERNGQRITSSARGCEIDDTLIQSKWNAKKCVKVATMCESPRIPAVKGCREVYKRDVRSPAVSTAAQPVAEVNDCSLTKRGCDYTRKYHLETYNLSSKDDAFTSDTSEHNIEEFEYEYCNEMEQSFSDRLRKRFLNSENVDNIGSKTRTIITCDSRKPVKSVPRFERRISGDIKTRTKDYLSRYPPRREPSAAVQCMVNCITDLNRRNRPNVVAENTNAFGAIKVLLPLPKNAISSITAKPIGPDLYFSSDNVFNPHHNPVVRSVSSLRSNFSGPVRPALLPTPVSVSAKYHGNRLPREQEAGMTSASSLPFEVGSQSAAFAMGARRVIRPRQVAQVAPRKRSTRECNSNPKKCKVSSNEADSNQSDVGIFDFKSSTKISMNVAGKSIHHGEELPIKLHMDELHEYVVHMNKPALVHPGTYAAKYLQLNSCDPDHFPPYSVVHQVCNWNFDWLLTYKNCFEGTGVWSAPPAKEAWRLPPASADTTLTERQTYFPSTFFSQPLHLRPEYSFFNTLMYYEVWEKIYWDWRQRERALKYIIVSYVKNIKQFSPPGVVKCSFLVVTVTFNEATATNDIYPGDLVRVVTDRSQIYLAYVDSVNQVCVAGSVAKDYRISLLFTKDITSAVFPTAMLTVTFLSHILPKLQNYEQVSRASVNDLAKGFAAYLKDQCSQPLPLSPKKHCYAVGDRVCLRVPNPDISGSGKCLFKGPFLIVSMNLPFVTVELTNALSISTHTRALQPFTSLCDDYLKNFQVTVR